MLGNRPKAAAVNEHVAIKIRRRCNSGFFRQCIESPKGTLNATMSKKDQELSDVGATLVQP